MSAILKQNQGTANSLVSALCENEAGALSANQNAELQCKINSANHVVVELYILHWQCVNMYIRFYMGYVKTNIY